MKSLAFRRFSTQTKHKFFIAGSQGQLGIPLTNRLIQEFGNDSVVVADSKPASNVYDCKQYTLDVTDFKTYREIVEKEKITYIVHYAAILSSAGEMNPDLARRVNFDGFAHACDIAREFNTVLFSPSSIAAYGGSHFNKDKTPLNSIMQP